ncbi:hypothetical protein [Saliniramus sp.]|uniref:hypothetical protein n=1 Tax=Saliniramus sp. TaxID=2986772 RepID=UPI002B97D1DC|nr:hypothetical protein [Saliniramus sp.]HMB12104.1 hypothetical protein [Saliniramus sp.]
MAYFFLMFMATALFLAAPVIAIIALVKVRELASLVAQLQARIDRFSVRINDRKALLYDPEDAAAGKSGAASAENDRARKGPPGPRP